jgi:serine-type D-Ala-D-Ala carboxypeptidase/endopeptidase (penicillin-binding protein 4)
MKFAGNILLILIFLLCLDTTAFAKKRHLHSSHASHAKAAAPVNTSIYGTAALDAEINRAIANVNPNLNVGVQIKSMRHGDTLYTRNAYQYFVPASILKVFTAESALLFMGPEYKFPTVFATDAGSINNGVLQGNLYLIHSGDPSLTYYDLSDLMKALKEKNIQRIAGNVYIDTSAYDQEIYGPGWISNDTRFCYAAPISASIINHNCMVVQVKRGKASQGMSSVVTNIIHYNKSLIQSLFQRNGIYISGSILPGVAPQKTPIIASHFSKPLRDLITEMLKKSDNIIAGSLFKKMGELYANQPGSWQNGGSAVKQILQQKMGVDIGRMNILDGSGLSRNNQIAPAQMLQVLDFAYHNNATNYDFISALPVAGVDGTLKNRMQNIRAKVRAKTGTMNGVVALAGYVITKENEPVAFVIIINGHLGMGWRYKEMENRIMTLITNYSR